MSRYSWLSKARGPETRDDPAGRAQFMQLGRLAMDPELATVRQSLIRSRAPPNGRDNLWQPLGPHTVVGGQAEGGPRITGRINSLAVDGAGERLYAASGHGGVWYSANGGSSWESVGGFAATDIAGINRPAQRHASGAVAVRFGADAAADTVFVGTGDPAHEPNGQAGRTLGGVGILVKLPTIAISGDDPWQREAKNLTGSACYRIALEPGGTGVVVATRNGLWQRPAVPGPNVDWVRPAGAPFNTLTDKCTDALWTAADGATRPARLWVWVSEGVNAGLWVREAGAVGGVFQNVTTINTLTLRSAMSASTPPTQIYLLNDQGSGNLPVLNRIANVNGAITAALAAGMPALATNITGVPDILKTQGFYDICVAVDPTNANRVTLGGSFITTTLIDGTSVRGNGAIVVANIIDTAGALSFGNAANPFTMIGVGVHADVHDLQFSNGGARLWTGCDGGVYRSDRPLSPVGFYARSHGISAVEPNFLGNHLQSEGHVAAGLQDNAVITRHSNGVWKLVGLGDGGGLCFDPLRPDRFMRQHFQGFWSSSDGTLNGTEFLTRAGTFATNEHTAAAFYSMPASIAHRRGVVPPVSPNVGQIIIGTYRLWYSENYGASWVTLPTGSDPLPANLVQDSLGAPIIVCRWQTPDVAWVLTDGALHRYSRTPGSDNGGGPGTWARVAIVATTTAPKDDGSFTFGPMRLAANWTELAVNLEPPAGPGGPPTTRGTLGAIYLGTSGLATDAAVDTLWWFDGTLVWYPTGLRGHAQGVQAPVTAVACDPNFPNEVWVGTTVGVWRGTRNLNGLGIPTWDWSPRLNGLPEAAVEDLSIINDGGLRLLRAAVAARGVWELRLDDTTVSDLTYLRAHQDDLRYRTPAAPPLAPVQRDGSTLRSWHGSPDVRPRLAPAAVAAPAAPRYVRGGANVNAEKLRRFQAALRSKTGDPRVRPTGVWDSYFNEVLRELGAPLAAAPAAANTVSISQSFWNSMMQPPHDIAEPWGPAGSVPTEADLHDFAPPLVEGDVARTSHSIARRACKVEVVVHHRGLDARNGSDVRVTLLRWIDPRTRNAASFSDSSTWFNAGSSLVGPVPWTAAVNDVLNGATGATALTFGGGWAFVGSTNATRRKSLSGQTLHSLQSGVASFDVNFSSFRKNRVVLLVAIIRAGSDINLQPATLQDLALGNSNVAVRSLRLLP